MNVRCTLLFDVLLNNEDGNELPDQPGKDSIFLAHRNGSTAAREQQLPSMKS